MRHCHDCRDMLQMHYIPTQSVLINCAQSIKSQALQCEVILLSGMWTTLIYHGSFNTLRPRQNGRHFADDTFKNIFLNENVTISIKISLKFIPKGPINNIAPLVQIMAWRRPGDKPLSSETMVVRLPTHICVTRPQWVKCAPMIIFIAFVSKLNLLGSP